MQKNDQARLAVLIDADNAPADIIDRLLEEIAKYGIASVKRIYGDWSHGLSKWKAALLPHAIIPVQQFAYTKGKNATDMALVIDAMDLLYSGNFDGFCIVSSDSDFTRLASRLRESGLTVYGFGEKKTPEAFRRACDKFVYTEIFRPERPTQSLVKNRNGQKKSAQAVVESEKNETALDVADLVRRAVKENADDLGWANLGPIGSYINKINPDFDARLYGFGKLSDLIKSLDLFEYRTDNNQLQVRRLSHEKNAAQTADKAVVETQDNALQVASSDSKTAGKPDTARHQPKSADAAEKIEKPVKSKGKPSFTKLIPRLQDIIQAHADEEGWMRLGDLLRHFPEDIEPAAYGFADARSLVHAIYADWVEIKKAGRGERIRINKRFVKV